uniref:DUF2946 domain-containing protein n=2 Tax=Agrobacterium rosae TaxID=1972867 RepID=A0AAW9FJF3_9HYPH|nr:hypothetical protein [Agrobacterium rosae]MDX8302943.1 hypothetical protein [Agrobacterium rosae]
MLMFLACMLCSAMPAQAALSTSMPVNTVKTHVSEMERGEHAMPMASSENAEKGDPCPHLGSTTHAPFCAACLVLIPELRFAEKGRAPLGYPRPELQQAFIGNIPPPPLPPPRA